MTKYDAFILETFVSKSQAINLKKLGYSEPSFAKYNLGSDDKKLYFQSLNIPFPHNIMSDDIISCPTYYQALDFLIKKINKKECFYILNNDTNHTLLSCKIDELINILYNL